MSPAMVSCNPLSKAAEAAIADTTMQTSRNADAFKTWTGTSALAFALAFALTRGREILRYAGAFKTWTRTYALASALAFVLKTWTRGPALRGCL